MVRAIQQLQDAGVEADVWKIEGLDRREDCAEVAAAAHGAAATRSAASSWAAARTTARSASGWRPPPPCRGSSASPSAARPSGTPLTDWRAGRSTREEAVAEIARRYREWVDIFQNAGGLNPAAVEHGNPVTP